MEEWRDGGLEGWRGEFSQKATGGKHLPWALEIQVNTYSGPLRFRSLMDSEMNGSASNRVRLCLWCVRVSE